MPECLTPRLLMVAGHRLARPLAPGVKNPGDGAYMCVTYGADRDGVELRPPSPDHLAVAGVLAGVGDSHSRSTRNFASYSTRSVSSNRSSADMTSSAAMRAASAMEGMPPCQRPGTWRLASAEVYSASHRSLAGAPDSVHGSQSHTETPGG